MMKEFCVIGLGNFGSMVARRLTDLKCKVTAVDIDKAKVQSLQPDVDLAILADSTDRKILENLEVQNFDCFIVSTGQDSHASILITLHLKELGARKIVVKANSADHARILKKVGASEAVIPEEEMAVKVARSLAQPNIMDYLPLSEHYSIAEILTPARFVGKTLMDIQLRSKYHIEVIAIKDSATDEFSFIPSAAYVIKQSDALVVLGKEENIEKIRE
jgi:trk system potassium uptake protein TrkA